MSSLFVLTLGFILFIYYYYFWVFVCLCSSLFLEHVSPCFYLTMHIYLMIFLCLFLVALAYVFVKQTQQIYLYGSCWWRCVIVLYSQDSASGVGIQTKEAILIIPPFLRLCVLIIHISYIIVYPCLCPLMFCLFHFPDGGGSMFVHGLDLLGPAGDNPHVIGTGMEKRSETLCHQFLLKSHLDIFVIHPHYFLFFYFFI